jgi:uncharacterized protein (DUF433 family)
MNGNLKNMPSEEDLRGDLIQPSHPFFGIVWINPLRMGGTPCFTGTRVPIKTLFDYLEAGDSLDDFFEGFPGVSREQAIAVIDLAATGLFEKLGVK